MSSANTNQANYKAYRQLFLDHVGIICQKPPSRHSLLELLRTTWPGLTEQQVKTPTTRGKAFQKLLRRLREGRLRDATHELLDEVEEFYGNCCDCLHEKMVSPVKNKRLKTLRSEQNSAPVPYSELEREQDEHDYQFFCILSHSFPTEDPVECNGRYYERAMLRRYAHHQEGGITRGDAITIQDPGTQESIELSLVVDAISGSPDNELRATILAAEESYESRDERRKLTNITREIFPSDFNLCERFSFLHVSALPPVLASVREDEVAALAAAHCINMRGAIAHGRETELHFSIEQLLTPPINDSASRRTGINEDNAAIGMTVQDIFVRYGAGVRGFTSAGDIQQELISNGPVVSTSFVLHERVFRMNSRFARCFNADRVNQTHELVILGWKLTEFCHVWICKAPLQPNPSSERPAASARAPPETIEIAFGQFGIDSLCLAPCKSYKNDSWQKGPYWDRAFGLDGKKAWRNWDCMSSSITESDLRKLSMAVGGFRNAILDKTRFVLRDQSERADSRACFVKDVEWCPSSNKWKVQLMFLD